MRLGAPLDMGPRPEKAAVMATDEDIFTRIKALVDEEHSLSGSGSAERRQHLEEQLDQCWDLLRQRDALREAGADPDAAAPRSVGQVESYLQ